SLFPPDSGFLLPVLDDDEATGVHDVLRDPSPERQLDERWTRRIRAHLERVAPALDAARKLAEMPDGRYPGAWGGDVLSTRPPWPDAIRWTRPLLYLDALLRNEDGDPDGALLSARGLLNLGRSLGDEPFYYGPGHRNRGRYEAVQMVERTLA